MNAIRVWIGGGFGRLAGGADVALALAVGLAVFLLIVPLPGPVLDVLLALNLSAAALILAVAIFAEGALSLSTLPTLLLFTTLFRLGLNVSTTRSILAKQDAGEVVAAFGRFVLAGDVVVGGVVFLILTLVQFLVIGKGAERVAEVGARFTLDAMPGKQMSIDAALRSGTIDEAEAERRRDELGRESQLYGAMDGAMKFVKGDAIAGLIVTALNLVAGLGLAVVRAGMSLGEALDRVAILTVGDGLVSQIPALLITLATGVVVTRVAPAERGASLGASLGVELFGKPRALLAGAALVLALALVPGMPGLPFLVVAAGLVVAARVERPRQEQSSPLAALEAKLDATTRQGKVQRAACDQLAPTVVPIAIELDPEASVALGFTRGDEGEETELLGTLVPQLRDALFLETGVVFPGIRVRSHATHLPPGSFALCLREVPVAERPLELTRLLAVESPAELGRLGVKAAPTRHPLSGAVVSTIAPDDRAVVEAAGVQVFSPAGALALELAGVLRGEAASFLGLQEVAELVERLERAYPALVREVVPKQVSLPELLEILRRLVEEGVAIRDLKTILEALGAWAEAETDRVVLTERVRSALSRQIAHRYAAPGQQLAVLLLDPALEETIEAAIQPLPGGSCLAIAPELGRKAIDAIAAALQPMLDRGLRPVLLTTASVRRYVRALIERDLRDVAVLSYEELPGDLSIRPLGQVGVEA